MEIVNIYGVFYGQKRLCYTGRLYLAADRCGMTEAGLRAALAKRDRVTISQPESAWPRAENYYATYE